MSPLLYVNYSQQLGKDPSKNSLRQRRHSETNSQSHLVSKEISTIYEDDEDPSSLSPGISSSQIVGYFHHPDRPVIRNDSTLPILELEEVNENEIYFECVEDADGRGVNGVIGQRSEFRNISRETTL